MFFTEQTYAGNVSIGQDTVTSTWNYSSLKGCPISIMYIMGNLTIS